MIEKDARKTETAGSSEWDELAQMGDKETVGTSWDDLAGAESAVEGQRQDREEEVPEELRHGTETLTETELDEIRRQTEEGRREWTKNRRAEQAAERRERMLETLKNVGRKVLDIAGISMIAGTFAEARKRRGREALQRTRQEKASEQPQGEEAWGGAIDWATEEARRRQSEEALRQEEVRQEQVQREIAERLAQEAAASEQGDLKSKEAFEQKQAQVERELNDRLTTVEDLAVAAEAGDGASMRVVEYGGKEIPVYDMKGHQFALLSHDVGYRMADVAWNENRGIAQDILENPEVWARKSPTKEEFEASRDAARRDSNVSQLANTLSTSYFNSATMSGEHMNEQGLPVNLMRSNLTTRAVRYGFDHARAGSLVKIDVVDAGTPPYVEDPARLGAGALIDIDRLEDRNNRGYNEVAMMRYDDEGKPMKPDYLVVMDGKITDDTLKHAAFFGVPIVNVESQYYTGAKEKQNDDRDDNTGDGAVA